MKKYLRRLVKSNPKLKKSLKSVKNNLEKVFYSPIRIPCHANEGILNFSIKYFDRRIRSVPYKKNNFSSNEEIKIDNKVTELKNTGISKWEGLFSDPLLLEQLRKHTEDKFTEYNNKYPEGRSFDSGWYEEEDSIRYYTTNVKDFGRKRLSFMNRGSNIHKTIINSLMFNPLVEEVLTRYYHSKPHLNFLMFERLLPSNFGDSWHFDKLRDQPKAMLLLTDCDSSNGPLRYKCCTHNGKSDLLKPLNHLVFKHGVEYAYPGNYLVNKEKGSVEYGTGKAGDVIFFDTRGVHSGTQCLEGYRDAFVWYYSVETPRNRFLRIAGSKA